MRTDKFEDAGPRKPPAEAAPERPTPPVEATAPAPRGTLTLLVLLAATFMSTLDFFIVNVAIPSLQRELHASGAAIQLVVASYALGYGAFMITGGRLGDLLGRRRIYGVGMGLFVLSSAACGLAPSVGLLIAARAVQGFSGALMAPQVLALISTVFSGEAKGRAIAAYAVSMGVAAVLGQLVGGILIHLDPFDLGWRSCFLINLPVGIAALALLRRRVPESRADGRPAFDFGGTVLVTLALLTVVIPLIEGRGLGWPAWARISLGASIPLFTLFALFEVRRARLGRSPLVDMSLFRERAFGAGLVAQLLFWMGQASYFLILSLYLQEGRGLSALDAGLLFAALGAGYMATSLSIGPIARRLGRQSIALGGLTRLVGLALVMVATRLVDSTGSILWMIPGLAVDGAGMGLAIAPLASTVLSRISREHAGAASGVLTTAAQVGNALGVSLIGIVASRALTALPRTAAIGHAFGHGLIYLMGVALAVAITAQLLPRRPPAAG